MSDTKITDEQIVAAVHKACGLGRVSLTHINNDGEEVPTDVAKCFAKAIAAISPPSAAVQSERKMFNKMFGDAINRADISAADMPHTVATKLKDALWEISSALPPAVQVPPGWKLVPSEPTPEWVRKFEGIPEYQSAAEDALRQALNTAPSPSDQGGE